jgi:Concanavalin A-like lectin/glucanases superfamily
MVAAYRRGTFGTGVVRGNGLALQQSGVVSLGSVVIPGDTNFASNVLLTKTNSINASTNTTFLDSSSNALTITRNGNPTQGSFTPYWPSGYWSGYFDGSSYLAGPTTSALNFGTGNYTVEFWVYPATTPSTLDIYLSAQSDGTNVFQIGFSPSQYLYSNADSIRNGTASSIILNQWNHVALVRSGTSVALFSNGTRVGTASNSLSINLTNFYVGTYSTSPGNYNATNAYISNVRFSNAAIYNPTLTTYTIPTSPLTAIASTSLLTLQDNRFKDNSTNSLAITASGTPKIQAFQPFSPTAAYSTSTYGGSGYFNGSTDYLKTPISALGALDISNTTTYTIEAWVYWTASAGMRDVWTWGGKQTGGPSAYYQLYWDTSSNVLKWEQANTSSLLTTVTTSLTPTLNTWYHIAVVRNGSAITVYANGQSIGTGTYAPNDQQFVELCLGSLYYNTGYIQFFSGYISNFRFVKGTAVYTAAFTPPTTPLTAIANTNFLANFTNAGIYDSTAQTDIITTGTAQVSTTQFKWSPTSMKFNGTSDYLTTPSNPALALRTGDFTVEFWMYPTAAQTGDIIDTRVSGDSANSWCVQLDSTNIHFTGVGSNYLSYPYTINTWTHVAYTRVSGSVSVYINGTKYGSSVTLTNDFTGTVYRIGATFNNFYYAGYIQDLRVTKGLARYTANFTAPTTTFSNGPTTYTPAVPDAPIIANITTVTNTSVKIGYMAPLLNGGSTITSYTAVSTPGGYTGTSVTSRSGTITVSGLAYSNTYTFAVYATNAIGTSTYSASTKSITTPLSLGRIFILADMDLALTDLVMLNTSIAGSSKAKSYALATIYGSD